MIRQIFRNKSNIVFCEVSWKLKINWLVNKCKNTHTKVTASRAKFFLKINTFFLVRKSFDFPNII